MYLDVDHVATPWALPRNVKHCSVGFVLLPLASKLDAVPDMQQVRPQHARIHDESNSLHWFPGGS